MFSRWHNLHWHLLYSYNYLFYGSLIFHGKKGNAFNFLLQTRYGLKLQEKLDPSLVFLASMLTISPNIVLFSIKKSGIVQGAPFPIGKKKRITFAVKWVVKALKEKYRVVTVTRIVQTLVGSFYNKGVSVEKRDKLNELAHANRHLINFYR
jgi:ribosomal protein S7